MTMLGIKYISLYDNSGYGRAAKSYLLGLAETGIPITWTPMIPGNSWRLGYEPYLLDTIGDAQLDCFCNKPIDYDCVIIHTVPEYYPLWGARETGKKIIGYTVWETDCIPDHWLPLLNGVHQLLVPCHWNKEVFQKCGVTPPIAVIPHIMEQLPSISPADWLNIAEDDYVFYYIGTWTNRKAPWRMLEAFCQTFTATDKVTLVLKTSREDFSRRFFNRFHGSSKRAFKLLLKNYASPPRIKFIIRELTDTEIWQLHNRGDCFFSLTRSEGWGLGSFEAVNLGKPVIITGFGGHLDYLSEDLSYLVDYQRIPIDNRLNCASYTHNQHWAEADLCDARKQLKAVYNRRLLAKQRAEKLQAQVQQKFNRHCVTKQFLAAIVG